MSDLPRIMVTAAEYAEKHGVSADTVQRWWREKKLPGYKSPDVPRGTLLVLADAPAPTLRPGRPKKAEKADS